MDYVRLGRSGLVCSVLGLGGGSSSRFGLEKGGSRSDALQLIRTALDHGITFFDGAGMSGGIDDLLAEGLAGRRQDVVLSTKVHLGPDPLFTNAPLAHRTSSRMARRLGSVCSGSVLRKRVERTLSTLRTDRLDVLHLHAVSPRQYPLAIARVLPELLKIKEEGKVRAIGVTEEFLADPGHEMLRKASLDAHFDVIMVGFNVNNSGAAEFVLPAANKAGLGVIGMFALRQLMENPLSSNDLRRVAEDAGSSLSDLAYRYCRHHAGIDVVMTGTGNPAHLRTNIAAALAPPLADSVLARLQQRSADQADVASTRK